MMSASQRLMKRLQSVYLCCLINKIEKRHTQGNEQKNLHFALTFLCWERFILLHSFIDNHGSAQTKDQGPENGESPYDT
jgi:hypothetical protein